MSLSQALNQFAQNLGRYQLAYETVIFDVLRCVYVNLFSLCISLSICYQGRSRVKCAHLYNGCCMAALEGRSSGMALQ